MIKVNIVKNNYWKNLNNFYIRFNPIPTIEIHLVRASFGLREIIFFLHWLFYTFQIDFQWHKNG
ncbi:MAG: hypothetical protein J7L26_12650 [Candidatus Aminicenantes bacterium]|nr:hypothetical protein [Candidatus Aminicenantes bacterium]